jgi:hypothetical protein
MAQWLGERLFGEDLRLTDTLPGPDEVSRVLNYSSTALACPSYQVVPQGLLSERGVHPLEPGLEQGPHFPVFFATTAGDHPFDLLAAAFFLISRYEEYLPFALDEYGRYAHTQSLAFRHGFLHRPLVDEWLQDLRHRLRQHFPGMVFRENNPALLPTYDIDLAWSYRHKGWRRSLGGALRDASAGRGRALLDRLRVVAGWQQDPFDIFDALEALHAICGLPARYFVLMARRNRGYDKNILPGHPAMKKLIGRLAKTAGVGIHFSWAAAGDPGEMLRELACLNLITGGQVAANRMHYLNFHLPQTYAALLAPDLGIAEDWSMGYGTINGFRASTSLPFYWYHLGEEKITPLRIIPFGWMDANSIFEQKDPPEKAAAELRQMWSAVQTAGGSLVTIGHNHLLGQDAQGRAWWSVYRQFLKECSNGVDAAG